MVPKTPLSRSRTASFLTLQAQTKGLIPCPAPEVPVLVRVEVLRKMRGQEVVAMLPLADQRESSLMEEEFWEASRRYPFSWGFEGLLVS